MHGCPGSQHEGKAEGYGNAPIVRPAASRGKSPCRGAPPDRGCRELVAAWWGKGTSPESVMSQRRGLLGGQGLYCRDEVPGLRGAVWCARHSDGGHEHWGPPHGSCQGGLIRGRKEKGLEHPGCVHLFSHGRSGLQRKEGRREGGGGGICRAREGRGTTDGPARVLRETARRPLSQQGEAHTVERRWPRRPGCVLFPFKEMSSRGSRE